MNPNNFKNNNDVCEFLKIAKTAEDFFVIQFIVSNLFYNKNKKDIDSLLKERDNFYINAIENVFNNPNFLEAIRKILEQYKAFQKILIVIRLKIFSRLLTK